MYVADVVSFYSAARASCYFILPLKTMYTWTKKSTATQQDLLWIKKRLGIKRPSDGLPKNVSRALWLNVLVSKVFLAWQPQTKPGLIRATLTKSMLKRDQNKNQTKPNQKQKTKNKKNKNKNKKNKQPPPKKKHTTKQNNTPTHTHTHTHTRTHTHTHTHTRWEEFFFFKKNPTNQTNKKIHHNGWAVLRFSWMSTQKSWNKTSIVSRLSQWSLRGPVFNLIMCQYKSVTVNSRLAKLRFQLYHADHEYSGQQNSKPIVTTHSDETKRRNQQTSRTYTDELNIKWPFTISSSQLYRNFWDTIRRHHILSILDRKCTNQIKLQQLISCVEHTILIQSRTVLQKTSKTCYWSSEQCLKWPQQTSTRVSGVIIHWFVTTFTASRITRYTKLQKTVKRKWICGT